MSRESDSRRNAVDAFMRAHPTTLPFAATVSDAVDVLDVYQLMAVPLIDDAGAYAGLLPVRAVLAMLVSRECGSGADARIAPAVVLDAPTLSPSDPMTVAVAYLTSGDRDVIPVTEDGRVVGTVGHAEVCRYLRSVCLARQAEHDDSGT